MKFISVLVATFFAAIAGCGAVFHLSGLTVFCGLYALIVALDGVATAVRR